jgi:hypothetical protein
MMARATRGAGPEPARKRDDVAAESGDAAPNAPSRRVRQSITAADVTAVPCPFGQELDRPPCASISWHGPAAGQALAGAPVLPSALSQPSSARAWLGVLPGPLSADDPRALIAARQR